MAKERIRQRTPQFQLTRYADVLDAQVPAELIHHAGDRSASHRVPFPFYSCYEKSTIRLE